MLDVPDGACYIYVVEKQAEPRSHPGAIGRPGVHRYVLIRYSMTRWLCAAWFFLAESRYSGSCESRNGPGIDSGFTSVCFMEGGKISELMINGQIRDREVRLISENGDQLGIMPTSRALQLAEEAGLDLVKIAPKAQPPVCKIIDYGKYRYEQTRKEKEARKKQKIVEVKEVRMSPNIDENDLNTKIAAARKFIEKGNKVKVSIRFRGREMAHTNQSRPMMEDFAAKLSDIANVEKPPKMEGRFMTMFLAEKSKK